VAKVGEGLVADPGLGVGLVNPTSCGPRGLLTNRRFETHRGHNLDSSPRVFLQSCSDHESANMQLV
jgi:hypothetical protein